MKHVLFLFLYLCCQANSWCLQTSIQEPGTIVQVDYAPNNLYFVTANSNGFVNIYDTSTHQILYQYSYSGKIPTSVKYSKNSAYIGIGYKNTADVIVLNGAPPFAVFRTIGTGLSTGALTVGEVDFKYDNTQIMACGDDRIKSFYLSNGNVNINKNPSGGGSDSIACRYSPNNYMALAYQDKEVFIFDASGNQIYNTNYNDFVNEFDFQPSSNNFVSAIQNNSVRANSTVVFTDSDSLKTISYSKLGNIISFGGQSKKLYIVDSSYNKLAIFTNFDDTIFSVKISSDEQTIITGDNSGKIFIYTKTCPIQCQSGQYNSSNVCKKCTNLFSYCSQCTSAACSMCLPGYFISGSSCATCSNSLTGCFTCNTSAICLTCFDGYYLTAGNTCSLCISAMEACIECNTSLICTQCLKNDYYLDTGTNSCLKCVSIAQCIKCYNSTFCVQCQLGFYADASGVCQQCTPISTCLVCQSSSNCTQCKVGYYANSGTCNRCSSNCLQCNQTGLCYECQQGWYLNGGNTCSQCVTPCLTCFGTSTNCTQCIVSGFYYSGSNVCTTCDVNCQTCNSTVTCLSCYVGYIYNGAGPNCLACSNSYPNCSQCTSSICQACHRGFYLDGGNLCQTCNIIPFCIQCASSTNCTQCSIGFYNNGGIGATSCSVCSLGCQQCISSTNCTNCAKQYYKNASNLCSPCPNHCVQCQTNTYCQSCQIGYYIDGTTANLCVSCQTTLNYCSACLNSTNCLTCMIGTYLDATSKCQFCTSNCLTCNLTDCQSCEIGYYLGGTPLICTKCNQFCQQCSSSALCMSCINNYYLNTTDSTCRNCSLVYPHCQQCNQANCLRCTFGYTLNGSNICVPCQKSIAYCIKCDLNSVPTLFCEQCSYGFYLATNNLSCLSCNSIFGCVACYSSTICIKCEVGFYLTAGSTCGVCNSSCLTCNNAATCIDCKKGWIWDTGSSQCQLCEGLILGCQTCLYAGLPLQLQCSQCNNGFYLFTDNLCHLCQNSISGCYFCNDSSICTLCLDSYYKKVDNTCDKCSIIQGCQLCNSSSVCLQCESGFYLNTGNTCSKCISAIGGCLYCSDLTHCLQCQSSYYLDSNSLCQLCQSQLTGCMYCNDISTCIQCRSGYYLDSGTHNCLVCAVQGCEICLQSLPTKCLSCNSGFYLDSNNDCQNCNLIQQGCTQCSNTICTQCDIGYYLTSGTLCDLCSNPLDGCSICSANNVCLQCKSGYFVNSSNLCQQCSSMISGCQYCINGSSCMACQVNFYLNSSTHFCSPCTNLYGCLICQNETTCLLCDTKYYLTGTTCNSCSIMLGCFDCITNNVCIQCDNGYILDTNSNLCVVNQVEQKLPITGFKLVSFYVDKNTLKHILYAQNYTFTPTSSNITSNGLTKLQLVNYSGNTTDLVITSYSFGSNGYTLIFYTNNPLGSIIQSSTNSYSFTRRFLLTSPSQNAFQINLNANLNMDQTIYNQILPAVSYSGALSVSYNLNSPQFYKSYFQAEANNSNFQIFGYVVIVLFLLNYAIKYFKTCPKSVHRGQLFAHVISVKACCLILYPTYFDYINFCGGLMVIDFPWINDAIADQLTNTSDSIQTPFGLFFTNMGIFGTFLLGIAIYLLFYVIGRTYFSQDQIKQKSDESQSNDSEDLKSQQIKLENVQKQIGINYKISPEFLNDHEIMKRNYFQFLNNIFCFGMIFYSCVSFQGAFYNPTKIVDLNGLNYILGILIYIGVVIESFYSFFRNTQFINKIRLLFKVTLLALGYINPIYIVSLCVVLDSALIYVQYFVVRKKDDWTIHYTVLNGICNLNLLIMIFIPQYKLCIVLVIALVSISFILQAYLHFKQYKKIKQNLNLWDKKNHEKLKQNTSQQNFQNYTKRGKNNIWDLNAVKDKNVIAVEEPDEEVWYKQKQKQDKINQAFNITGFSTNTNQNQIVQDKNKSRNRRGRNNKKFAHTIRNNQFLDVKQQKAAEKSPNPFTFDEQDLE